MKKELKIGIFIGLAVVFVVAIYFATRKDNSVETRALENTTPIAEPNLAIAEVNIPAFDANGISLPTATAASDANASSLTASNTEVTSSAPAADSTLFEQSEPVKTSKFHVVRKGDTLSSISKKYYGSTKYTTKIYEANKGVMKSKNTLKIGMKLTIPE